MDRNIPPGFLCEIDSAAMPSCPCRVRTSTSTLVALVVVSVVGLESGNAKKRGSYQDIM
jgi:hypothetical protein